MTTEIPDPTVSLRGIVDAASIARDAMDSATMKGPERRAVVESALDRISGLAGKATSDLLACYSGLDAAIDASSEKRKQANAKLTQLTGSGEPSVWAQYMEALCEQIIGGQE